MRAARLQLEFARGSRRVSWTGRALLLLSLALLGYGMVQLGDLWAAKAKAASALGELDARNAVEVDGKARVNKPDPRQVASTRAARQVASTLMTPWAGLLTSLGSAPNQAVALLSVEPSATKHSVRLTAEARDLHDMLVYLGTLQRDVRLSSVVLVSHQVQIQAPGTPVRFLIQADWGDVR